MLQVYVCVWVWACNYFYSKNKILHFNLNILSKHRSCEKENRIVQIHWVWKDFFFEKATEFFTVLRRLLTDILISLLLLFFEGFSESHIRGSRLLIFINRERIWKGEILPPPKQFSFRVEIRWLNFLHFYLSLGLELMRF